MGTLTARDYLAAIAEMYRDAGAEIEFAPPLGADDLDALLGDAGAKVPDWLRELWLVADGAESFTPVFARTGFLTGFDFLSVAQSLDLRRRLGAIAANFADWAEPEPRDERIRPGWFPSGWVPFAAFGGSSLVLFADGDPASTGQHGQVIAYVHDPDAISLVAPDGARFLTASLAAFHAGSDEFLADI